MPSLRFLLILSAHSNLLRAALVTRDLRIAASAQQTFQITETDNAAYTFDPAEVWYKAKRIVGACLDIGRTLSREIAGLVLVTEQAEKIVWSEINSQVLARGVLSATESSSSPFPDEFSSTGHPTYVGTIATWLLWNLTGEFVSERTADYGKTRARSPFDAQLPILAVWRERHALEFERQLNCSQADRPILAAARHAWAQIPQ